MIIIIMVKVITALTIRYMLHSSTRQTWHCSQVVTASRLGQVPIRDGKPREFESRQCQIFSCSYV